MATIIIPGMSRSGMSSAAFSNKLTCPGLVIGLHGDTEMCNAQAWQFVEKVGVNRIRYRCKACRRTILYEFSATPGHPYEGYAKKSQWQRIVEQWKKGQASRGLKIPKA